MVPGELWFQRGEELKVILSFSVFVEMQCGGFTLEVLAPQPTSLFQAPTVHPDPQEEKARAFLTGWSFVLFLLNL